MTSIIDQSQIVEQNRKISSIGKVLLAITGGAAATLTLLCIPFVSPAFRKICLPYIPATEAQLLNVTTALRGKKGRLLDIGSGDGRIVLEAAKSGFQADGIELNPWLVLYSKIDAFKKGQAKQTQFFHGDLWKFNISPYNYVVIFGVEQMMSRLESKFLAECGLDCEVVVCRFPLPTLRPLKVIGSGIDSVWVYKIPPKI